jgi:RNA 3'-terminal phosphate cyclase (ATP)
VTLLPIDGAGALGGGYGLRVALTLAAATGRGFLMTRIRSGEPRTGLTPAQATAVRALALACAARVGGAFDGSPDVRFEPGLADAGEYRFDIVGTAAATPVLQAMVVALATARGVSRVAVTGGTHVAGSPSFHYLAGPWAAAIARLGFAVKLDLTRAGFAPAGGGEIVATVEPRRPPAGPLAWDERGALLGVRGVSVAARAKVPVAEQQQAAAAERLWEARRMEAEWDTGAVTADSPGSALLLHATFEQGCAGFDLLGERGGRAEVLGDRAARMLLKFLEGSGAVDPHLADQLAVPLAIAGGGGRIATPAVSPQLLTAASLLAQFGYDARVSGRTGAPGVLEVAPGPPAAPVVAGEGP